MIDNGAVAQAVTPAGQTVHLTARGGAAVMEYVTTVVASTAAGPNSLAQPIGATAVWMALHAI